MRHRWKLSLQIRGDGPRAPHRDGFTWRRPRETRPAGSAPTRASTGRGSPGRHPAGSRCSAGDSSPCSSTREPARNPSRASRRLPGDSLAECAETLLRPSPNSSPRGSPSRWSQRAPTGRPEAGAAAGILIQRLPEGDPGTPDRRAEDGGTFDRAEEWNRLRILLETAQPAELTGPAASPEQVVRRLFPGEDPVFSPADPVLFGLQLRTREGPPDHVHLTSARDIRSMTDARGLVTADCQFCGARYEFEPETLGSGAKP